MLESLLTHLNETEKGSVLQALFSARSFEAFLTEQATTLSSQPARLVADLSRMRLEANKRFEAIQKLHAHTRRSSSRPLRAYVEAVSKLATDFKTGPTRSLWQVLSKHAEHCQSVIEELQTGSFAEELCLVTLETLREDLAKDAEALLKQIAKSTKSDNDEVDEEDVHDHEKFVKALQKEFSIEVHHFEPVNEGVFIFLDEENNEELLDALKAGETVLNRITGAHGYILLRMGSEEDIVWGSYPKGMAKWVFVKCPQDSDSESWVDGLKDMEDEIISSAKKMKSEEPSKSKEAGRDVRAQ